MGSSAREVSVCQLQLQCHGGCDGAEFNRRYQGLATAGRILILFPGT
jgi:hypothetical protein